MPMVNGKKFPYTAAGKKAAKKAVKANPRSERASGVAKKVSSSKSRSPFKGKVKF